MTLTKKELKHEEHKQLPTKTCTKCHRVSKTEITADGICDTCLEIRPHRKDRKKHKRQKKEK